MTRVRHWLMNFGHCVSTVFMMHVVHCSSLIILQENQVINIQWCSWREIVNAKYYEEVRMYVALRPSTWHNSCQHTSFSTGVNGSVAPKLICIYNLYIQIRYLRKLFISTVAREDFQYFITVKICIFYIYI